MDNDTCTRAFANMEQIKSCRKRLKSGQESFTTLSRMLALAGNEARLKIIYLLQKEEELCPCDLADILGMSIPAISQHLRKLKDGNVVVSRKVAQTVYYSLAGKNLQFLGLLFTQINFQTSQLQPI